jgi:polysaccharide chain length determinant protein (PEP-CTERM system associated)
MNQSPTLTLTDYWQIIVRKKWLIVGFVLLSVIVAAVLCYVLPKSYRSSTLILVEGQQVPEDYVKATVNSSIEERLTMIQQQVMSRTLLTSVVDEFKIYQEEIKKDGMESVIGDLRKNIKVETVGANSSGGPRGVEAFTISFGHRDPKTALNVTARLASLFIQENLKVREQLAEGTSEFLDQELQLAKSRLEEKEQAIREFKSKHLGVLPQQMEANLRALDRLQDDLISITEMYNMVSGRFGNIEKAIREYEATGKSDDNLIGGGEGGIDHLHARLRELERNLSILTSEYKDTYPDVVQTKQEIEKLKIQLAAKYREMDREAESRQRRGTEPRPEVDTETRRVFDPYLRELIKQRNEIKLELAGLEERRRRLTAQMKEYENRVERTPALEQELMLLVRDYDNMQNNYQKLLDKKLNARVAENLEKRQKGEQFRIIDPANLPEKPEKPDQLRIMLMGLAIGCALGIGSAISLEQLQPVFRRTEEIEILLGLPILATIPSFQSALGGSAKLLLPPSNIPSQPGNTQRHTYPRLIGTSINGEKGLNWIRGTESGHGKKMSDKPRDSSAQQMPCELNLVSKWRPWSVVAEQFRVAATRLTLMQASQASTVTVITSAVKGEGKSAVSVNLGYVLARDLGKSTLIVDCDLKCPMVHSYTGIRPDPGLREILNGDQLLDSCLQSLGDVPLWVLPAGGDVDQPIELSKMHQLTSMLTELRTRFDYIILDAPPILPLADMHVLAEMADIVALVIRAGVTRQAVVQKALNTLRPKNGPCIILNGLQSDVTPYYMQEGYDYFVRRKELPRV